VPGKVTGIFKRAAFVVFHLKVTGMVSDVPCTDRLDAWRMWEIPGTPSIQPVLTVPPTLLSQILLLRDPWCSLAPTIIEPCAGERLRRGKQRGNHYLDA
jgi:hypothetical protein